MPPAQPASISRIEVDVPSDRALAVEAPEDDRAIGAAEAKNEFDSATSTFILRAVLGT